MKFREYPDFDGLSTLSEEIKALYIDREYRYLDYEISVKTLKSIFAAQKVKIIDFLKIDVEGHELSVLKSNDWSKYRPKVVTFEGTDGKNCIKYCKNHNYRLEFFDGLNYYMVDNDCPDITIHSFAGAVLTKGIYTEREKDLLTQVVEIESNRQLTEDSLSDLQERISSGFGIKTSLKSLLQSVKRRITKS